MKPSPHWAWEMRSMGFKKGVPGRQDGCLDKTFKSFPRVHCTVQRQTWSRTQCARASPHHWQHGMYRRQKFCERADDVPRPSTHAMANLLGRDAKRNRNCSKMIVPQ